jgi:hypothetical protein
MIEKCAAHFQKHAWHRHTFADFQEKVDFFAQMATGFAGCLFRAQKSLDFQGPPLTMALEMDLAALKNHYASRHINNRNVNSYIDRQCRMIALKLKCLILWIDHFKS